MVRPVSIGLFSMYGAVPDLISIDLADALLFAAFAVTWTGASSRARALVIVPQCCRKRSPPLFHRILIHGANDEGAAAIAVSSPLSSVGQL
jgi:hypothetical protein